MKDYQVHIEYINKNGSKVSTSIHTDASSEREAIEKIKLEVNSEVIKAKAYKNKKQNYILSFRLTK